MDAHESATFNSGTGSHISIYLALVEPTNLPVASQIYAELTIRMIDKIHDIKKSTKGVSKRAKVEDLSTSEEEEVLTTVSKTPPAHYTLKIKGFSSLAKNNIESHTTAEFEAGRYKWKLILYPNGKKSGNGSDNISVYLMLAESCLPRSWSEVHVVFRVSLLDQNKDKYYTLQFANERRFHKMKLEWGFDQFMPLQKFNDPSNCYLVNDTCVFGAEVYVCKENNNCKGERFAMLKNVSSYKYSWKIDGFSSIANKNIHDSVTFRSDSQKWKIRIYPKGNGSHISIYLNLAEPASLPIASQICTEFTIRVINQSNGKPFTGKARYWFSRSNYFYGLAKFMPLTQFSSPSNGYLVNDSCTIEAEVSVLGVTAAL